MLCLRPGPMTSSIRPCCFCGLPLAMAALPATQGQKGIWDDSNASCDQVHWHPGQWSGQAVPGGLWVTGSCLTSSQMQRLALSSGHPGNGDFKSASGVLEMALLARCGEKAWSHSWLMGAPACWWGAGR